MMNAVTMTTTPLPRLSHLPRALPQEDALCLTLQEGIPLVRASGRIQARIVLLLQKQQEHGLSAGESEEFDFYEELDDYLSLLNRITRNLFLGVNMG